MLCSVQFVLLLLWDHAIYVTFRILSHKRDNLLMIMHENRFAQVTRVLPYSESRLKALPLLEQGRSWPALWTLSSWAAERSAWSQLLRACLSSSIFVSFSPNHFQPISALPLLKLTWHPTCCYFLKNRPITNLAWRRLLLSNPNHYLWISWWKFGWIARGKELNSIVKRLPLLQSDSLGWWYSFPENVLRHHFTPLPALWPLICWTASIQCQYFDMEEKRHFLVKFNQQFLQRVEEKKISRGGREPTGARSNLPFHLDLCQNNILICARTKFRSVPEQHFDLCQNKI